MSIALWPDRDSANTQHRYQSSPAPQSSAGQPNTPSAAPKTSLEEPHSQYPNSWADESANPMNLSIYSPAQADTIKSADAAPIPQSVAEEPSCFDCIWSTIEDIFSEIAKFFRWLCCCCEEEIDYAAQGSILKSAFDSKKGPDQRKSMRSLAQFRIQSEGVKTDYETCLATLDRTDFEAWLEIYSKEKNIDNFSKLFNQVKQDCKLVFRMLDYTCAYDEMLEIENDNKDSKQALIKALNLPIENADDKKAFDETWFTRLSSNIDGATTIENFKQSL